MSSAALLVTLLAIVTALAALAERVRIASPIVLVLAGITISLIPGLPEVVIRPDVIILIFLPPLIYAAAWNTSWADFKANFRPILLLAFGLVLFSTAGVAWVAHTFIPGFSWPLAFVMGATVSTTDPIAGTAVIKQMGLPRRVIAILEAESLVNDATGLIAYRYAVVAVTTGNFVLLEAGQQFLVVVLGGILIGVALAWLVKAIHQLTNDTPVVETTLTLLMPFAGYIVAEELHVSGVLAVLSSGLFLTLRSSEFLSRQAHLQIINIWNVVTFLLNSAVFVFMGLQLRRILMTTSVYSPGMLIGYGALISLAVIVARFVWVFLASYIPRLFGRHHAPLFNNKLLTVIGWTGMRGVLSLATALALPLTLANKSPFPHRDLVIFFTCCVIFSTLVLQGIALPFLIRWLNIEPDQRSKQDEVKLRIRLAASAIEHLESNYSLSDDISDEALALLKHKYETRIDRLRLQQDRRRRHINESEVKESLRIQQEIIQVEREMVSQLRREGRHDDEVLRTILYELDLEESRLLMETMG
ncbi:MULTISPECIES: Na+/H+ antiporter [Spirosoma]|uniref:Na+/H+ antiporter n=1 Tax=Spirosoma liriopis TaxID=2937440 RepID=A0ABT0HG39_9BACT|nr:MULTISPECIES: Na+/H+ antiporter [Spirosoma]MCK8490658.1 Na+/H+ antiporter [Spirosoma liriopis]UHG90019.1 Na+/H+ antiporter [Spirosoma oryzicola]